MIFYNILFFQGYSRLGAALSFLKRYDEAEKAYTKGLQLDPENAQLKSGLEEARAMAQRKYYLKILIMSVCFAFSFYHFSVCTVTL